MHSLIEGCALGDVVVARGEGFSATDQVSYFVRVRNAQGDVIASGEPVIEPLESPPGG